MSFQSFPAPGIAALYHLEDVNDSSGNSKTLSNSGGCGFDSGKLGNGADFGDSNTTKYLYYTGGYGVNLAGDCGFSMWLRHVHSSVYQGHEKFIDWRSTTGTGRAIIGTLYAGGFYFSVGGTEYQSSFYPTQNKWYKIDLSLSGSYAYFYVDGILIYTISRGSTSNSSNTLGIGGDGNSAYMWCGNIDEVVLYSCHRTARDIRRRFAFETGKLD